MEYAAQIWFVDSKQAASFEAVQQEALKDILQCNSKTNNIAAQAILGVPPLAIRRSHLLVTWYTKVLASSSPTLLALLPPDTEWVRGVAMERRQKWSSKVGKAADMLHRSMEEINKSYQEEVRFESCLLCKKTWYNKWSALLRKDSLEAFNKKWTEDGSSRLALLKHTLPVPVLTRQMEGTLGGAKLVATKLRLGTHALRSSLHKSDGGSRECPCCAADVEDVAHFLLHCPAYKSQRVCLVDQLKNSKWGYNNWYQCYVMQDDAGKCATLLGYPATLWSLDEVLNLSVCCVCGIGNMYEVRSAILQEATDKKAEEAKKAKKKKAKKKKTKKTKELQLKAAKSTHTISYFFTATGTGLLGPADQDPLLSSPLSRVRVGVDSSNPSGDESGRMGDNPENVSDY